MNDPDALLGITTEQKTLNELANIKRELKNLRGELKEARNSIEDQKVRQNNIYNKVVLILALVFLHAVAVAFTLR